VKIANEILIIDRSSLLSWAGRIWRRRRRSLAPTCHDLNRWGVISTKILKD